MAKARVIVKRRQSVRNIRKITRTMQLIATARFQASYNRATATKPYVDKLAELVRDISASSGQIGHPLMQTLSDDAPGVLLVLTSNRGLCGAFNSNILRAAQGHLAEMEGAGKPGELHVSGKKGLSYFKFLGRTVHQRVTEVSESPRFEQVEPLANAFMSRFAKGEISSVHVAFMRFISMGTQRAEVMQLLPLSNDKPSETGGQAKRTVEYEFSPDARTLMGELLPATVRVRLFQCFMDATVCEQISRMVAMKAATDAAGDMITSLTRQYNRARQTSITMELLDIVGGANALA